MPLTGVELDSAELIKALEPTLARFKLPKGAAFIDTIPRNPSGKILKRILRDMYPAAAGE